MRLSLRFIVPLLVVLAAFAYAVMPAIESQSGADGNLVLVHDMSFVTRRSPSDQWLERGRPVPRRSAG